MKRSVYYSIWASLLLSSQQSRCLSEFWSDCWWQSWQLAHTGPCMHRGFSALLWPRLSLFWHQFFSLCPVPWVSGDGSVTSLCCQQHQPGMGRACVQVWSNPRPCQHSLLTSSSQNPDAQWPRSSQFSCETNLLFLMINVSCREDG